MGWGEGRGGEEGEGKCKRAKVSDEALETSTLVYHSPGQCIRAWAILLPFA